MAKTLLKGSVSASFVDAQQRLQIINADNDLTDVGINRILTASSKTLQDDSFIFTNLLLTSNLPVDKNVYTDEELEPYLLGNVLVRTSSEEHYSKSITLIFQRNDTYYPYRPDVHKQGSFDLFSLAYKLDDKWYIASRARTRDETTGDYAPIDIPIVSRLTVYYKINVNLLEESDGVSFIKMDALINKNSMTIGETSFKTSNNALDPTIGIYVTRIPSDDGILKWRINNTSAYESSALLFTRLFQLSVKAPVGESEYEMRFITASELDSVTVPPTDLTSLDFTFHDWDLVNINIIATPNSDIFIYFNDALYAYAKTDPSGKAVTVCRTYLTDPFTGNEINVLDGQEFTVKIKNSKGEHIQTVVSNDTMVNDYISAFWESENRLVIAGKLGDRVSIYPDNKQIAISDEPLPTKESPLVITLDTPDNRFGSRGAIGYLDKNLVEDYKLAHCTNLFIMVTDAAGNVGYYKEERKSLYIGIPNHFMTERTTNNSAVNTTKERLVFTAIVTKGSRL